MDVVFGEDRSRIRQGHAAENMSFLRRFVTTLLKQDTSKSSLKQKRKEAAWDTDFLETLLALLRALEWTIARFTECHGGTFPVMDGPVKC